MLTKMQLPEHSLVDVDEILGQIRKKEIDYSIIHQLVSNKQLSKEDVIRFAVLLDEMLKDVQIGYYSQEAIDKIKEKKRLANRNNFSVNSFPKRSSVDVDGILEQFQNKEIEYSVVQQLTANQKLSKEDFLKLVVLDLEINAHKYCHSGDPKISQRQLDAGKSLVK